MKHVRHDPLSCPKCDHQLNASTLIEDFAVAVADADAQLQVAVDAVPSPSPDDVTICIRCGTILEYGEGLRLRFISEIAWEELDTEQKEMLKKVQSSIQTV